LSVSTPPTVSQPVRVQNIANLDPPTDFNVTHLWDDIWNATSRQNLLDYTRGLSVNYSGRTWYELDETPSIPLQSAWVWANETLKNNTGGQLAFHQVTDHKVLLAIKSGIGPSPRQAVLVTGVISSGPTPGANDVGSSVAAVLEIARVLENYTLDCDIYYVLTNRDTNNLTTDTGAKAFVSWLNQTKTETVTSLSFERILFDDIGYLYGTEIMLRSYSGSKYQESYWIRDLLMELSASRGASRVQYATDHGLAQKSMAYELWQAGRPAIHVSQGYWYDTYRDTSNDVWSNGEYSYDKAREIAACAACVVAFIGMLGESAASF
jgi:hypothetical protein